MKKKLKVIQYGINHEHAPGKYQSLGLLKDIFELVGVVDDTDLKSPSMPIDREIYRDAPFISSEAALNYPDLDCVLVEVPNLELVRIGKMFAERGIPMHMDKPCGESLEPYRELLELCEQKHLPFQMGYMYRGNPALNYLQTLLREGALGDISEVQMDMNHGYGGTRYQEYLGVFKGGIMFNLGCHLIDFVVSVFGAPEQVTPFLKSTPDGAPHIRNNALAVLEYPHTVVMLRACSHQTAGTNYRRWCFIGSNGMAEVRPPERFDGKPVELHLILKNSAAHLPAGETTIQFSPQQDRYIVQLKEFAEIIRGEKINPYTYAHDLLVHKITLAAAGYMKYKI